MKNRLLFYKILGQIEHKNAIVITGLRQVGKSTLMRQLSQEISSPRKLWFDFENPLDTKIFEDIDYRVIYERLNHLAVPGESGRLYVFIDEIQNYPEITKIIKYLIDHYGVKFFVTGSSSFYLRNLFPESLSGRKFLYLLTPMSFYEQLYFKDLLSLESALAHQKSEAFEPIDIFHYKNFEVEFEDYLHFGGFPEVVVTSDPETKKEILKNIFKSFFEKDLKILSDYKDIRELRDLLLLLVPRVGSLLDVSRLASELGVQRAKVYQYLEFLQATFAIHLLPKFGHGVDRSVAAGKKVYFADTGLLLSLGQVNEAQLLENAVVNQLVHYGELSFYNQRNTAEIDVILNKKVAFEVKLTGTANDYQKLSLLAKKLKLPKYFIVSKKFMDNLGFLSALQL